MNNSSPVPLTGHHFNDVTSTADRVNTLLCTNASFLQHAAVCLASLLANNPNLFFEIVIVAQATESLDEEKLRRSLTKFANHSLNFQKFEIPAGLSLPLITHYTVDTYTRLWVNEFFPANVDRVLYLDADLVVVGSIAQLWATDLDNALMAAVDIPGSERGVTLLGISAEDGYFNAGVLIIDLAQWRATRAEDIVLDYIRANPDRVRYDQDALNACFHSCTKRLAYKWNVIRPFYKEPLELPLGRAAIEEIRREAQIIHFNGDLKPWSYFCDHPRQAEYQRYLRMTEWRDYVPPDRTLVNMLRKGISVILPDRVKGHLKAAANKVIRTQRSAGTP